MDLRTISKAVAGGLLLALASLGLGVIIVAVGAMLDGAFSQGPITAQEFIVPVGSAAPPIIPHSPWRPVWDALITAIAGVLTIAIPALVWALFRWLQAKTGLQLAERDSALGRALDAAIRKGIVLGEQLVRERYNVPSAGPAATPGTAAHGDISKIATAYVVDRFPDALGKLGLDASQVEEMVRARIPEVTTGARP